MSTPQENPAAANEEAELIEDPALVEQAEDDAEEVDPAGEAPADEAGFDPSELPEGADDPEAENEAAGADVDEDEAGTAEADDPNSPDS